MSNLGKKIEIAANIAIIMVAIMIGVVLVNKYLFKPKSPALQAVPVGAKIFIPEIDWAKNGRTLVLALQDGCRFCSESNTFYQRLIPEAAANKVEVIAVFPHSTETGKMYLDNLKVSISNLRQVPLNTIGVNATPALLLVNNEGQVTTGWIGKLPGEKELEVLKALR
jgi:hypothetical protein